MTTTFSLTRLRKLTPLSKNIDLWPEPEVSIGTWYRRMGRLECWEAIGHAREVFITLSDEIKDLLGKRSEYLSKGEPIPPSITFGIYMIGRKKESATPTIIFSCKEAGPRKRAREIILESGYPDDYPGVKLGDTTYPPELDQVPTLLATDDMIIDTTNSDEAYKSVWCNPSEDIFGRRIFVRGSNNSNASQRKATAGGIFVSQGRYFYHTVGHVFAEAVEHGEEIDEQSFEFDIDGYYSDIYEENNDFVDTTSRGSLTPSCADSDETKVSEEPHIDISSQSQSYSCSSDQMTYDEMANSVVENGTFVPDVEAQQCSANAADIPCVILGDRLIGDLFMSSLNRSCADLDWALIEIKDPAILKILVPPPLTASTNESFPCPKRVGRIGSNSINILAVTSQGALSGTLSGCPTFMKSTGCNTFQEVWTVRLKGSLSNGDCGSWVIDAKTGDLYGHIVSGSLLSGVAYIVPAFQVLDSIKQFLGESVDFLSRPCLPIEQRIIYSNEIIKPQLSPREMFSSSHSYGHQRTPLPELARVLHSPTSTTSLNSSFTRTPSTQFSYSPNNSPPFEPTRVLYSLIDLRRTLITPTIQAEVDKGFFKADQDWTCYRRNYFSIACSYSLSPETEANSGELYIHRSNVLPSEPIEALGICISAKAEGKPIELVLHNPKRDKGPLDTPQIQELSPYPSDKLGLRGANVAIFNRIQFQKATANNGKRRAAQQYFHVLVELYAKVPKAPKGQSESQWIKVASRLSAPLVVRGRSPGHYQDERRNSSEALGVLQPSYPIPITKPTDHINSSSYKLHNSPNDWKDKGLFLGSGLRLSSRSGGLSSIASGFCSDSYDPYDSFDPSESSSRSSLAEYAFNSELEPEPEPEPSTDPIQPIAELPDTYTELSPPPVNESVFSDLISITAALRS